MSCPACDPGAQTTTSNCCLLSSSIPASRQYVRFTVSADAVTRVLVPARQLTNATPTILSPTGSQRLWLHHIQAISLIAIDPLHIYWAIGGNIETDNSYILRGPVGANGVLTYDGPVMPLPLGAEIFMSSPTIATISVVGFGFLETI